MQPEDVYALTSVGSPRLSPDGLRVAYVVNRIDSEANAYRSRIWVAPLDGSAEPREFTSGQRNWGYKFRLGLFAISDHDMDIIAAAMTGSAATRQAM